VVQSYLFPKVQLKALIASITICFLPVFRRPFNQLQVNYTVFVLKVTDNRVRKSIKKEAKIKAIGSCKGLECFAFQTFSDF
jgi:hypothetical protein